MSVTTSDLINEANRRAAQIENPDAMCAMTEKLRAKNAKIKDLQIQLATANERIAELEKRLSISEKSKSPNSEDKIESRAVGLL